MKTTTRNNKAQSVIEYEISDLLTIGWLQITSVGEENMYFTLADNSKGFVKVEV